jgi:hypothetical protein
VKGTFKAKDLGHENFVLGYFWDFVEDVFATLPTLAGWHLKLIWIRFCIGNALIMGKKLLAKMLRNENSQLFFVLINYLIVQIDTVGFGQ